tara:strand:- start:193 stop:1695 length:1503 start_codon:yes stop_codon:yes gene_type:complete
MAIKGVGSRSRRKKGEGAQISKSIVQVGKNKKSSALVKPTTPIFGGSKQTTETSSSIQSSSIVESLNKIDKSIANIRSIIESESKFKSKINANNLRKQNLLMKRTKEKELKSKKTSVSVTGRTISKMGSFLSRFLPFIVATLLGSVVLSIYKGLGAIIKFFQNIFNALNGFFAALDPFIRPILDFFNLFRKQDTGDLDPKIGETEEEEVNKLEEQVKDLDKQADEFVKEFNKQKEEFLKVSTQYQKTVQVAVDKINKDILVAQENIPSDTEGNASVDISMTDNTTEVAPTVADTTEITPTVSMVNNNINNIIPDKSDQKSDVKPTTSLVAKEEKKSSGNNISADKFFIDGKPPTYAGLRELEGRTDMNPYKHERKVREYTNNLSLYNKKMYGSNTPITFNGKTYEPGDPNYELVLQMTQAHFRKDLNKRDKLRQMIIKLEDQAFYETNQDKTDVIFVSQNTPQSSMGGKSFILPLGTGMGGVSALNSKKSSEFESLMYTT